MALHYFCRHCGIKIGTLDVCTLHSEQLGFHRLTEQERAQMIEYMPNGDVYVKTICEHCQEALERHPEFHQYEKFIQ